MKFGQIRYPRSRVSTSLSRRELVRLTFLEKLFETGVASGHISVGFGRVGVRSERVLGQGDVGHEKGRRWASEADQQRLMGERSDGTARST